MNKLGLSILSVLLGFAIGILTGYAIFKDGKPAPTIPASEQYYYRLNDTTAIRHTISSSDSGVVHKVDTLEVLNRGW
jgi:hypothetical protein